MQKPLMSPAYRVIDFVDSGDGEHYSELVLSRYDDEVHKELERQMVEGIPEEATSRFVQLAAANRCELQKFLEVSAHGPH